MFYQVSCDTLNSVQKAVEIHKNLYTFDKLLLQRYLNKKRETCIPLHYTTGYYSNFVVKYKQ